MMPPAIWPYIMGLCVALALACVLARKWAATGALLHMLGTLAALRLVSAIYGDSAAYLAIAAMLWAHVAHRTFRNASATAGGIIAGSALCYLYARYSGAPRVVGSVPFVVSDVLLVSGMVVTGRGGVAYIRNRALNLVKRCLRYFDGSGAVADR